MPSALSFLAHDTDPFNRWEAAQELRRASLVSMITTGTAPDSAFLSAAALVARDDSLDPAYRALVLQPIAQDDIAQTLAEAGHTPDPMAINEAGNTMAQMLAQHLADSLPRLYADSTVVGPYSPDAESAGKRAFNMRMLYMLTRMDGGAQARKQFAAANNMTQQMAPLNALLIQDLGQAETEAFYQQWNGDRLVMDKWFASQVAFASPENCADIAEKLTQHELFDMTNPNRFRSVFGALAMNHAGFHHPSGKGYRLLADWLIELDAKNPQTTARMCTAFQTWRRYDATRQAQIQAQLERILATQGLSPDTAEMVSRILEG